ncbi:MAG: hypothetical protein OCC49_00080 [Fibrobacterales bacterium]
MNKTVTLIFLMILIAFSQSHSASVCEKNKTQAKEIFRQCKSMKKGTSKYNTCKNKYNKLRSKIKLGCTEGGQDLNSVIKKWAGYVKKCKAKKNSKCANALKELAKYTYRKEEADFLGKNSKYEQAMERWENRDGRGKEPKQPKTNHKKSLGLFLKFIKQYPKHRHIPNVLMQASLIYMTIGKETRAYKLWSKLVGDYPSHTLAPQAWLRIGEYWFNQRKHRKAITAYLKVTGLGKLNGKEAAFALYHLAESYNNIGEYEQSAATFFKYITGADKGKYPDDLRAESLVFMAGAFADLDDGIYTAEKFMKDKGVTFKDTLYYEIGMKNRARDRLDEALKSFKRLLELSPNYVDAPKAHIAMVSIYEDKKRYDEAQQSRFTLIKNFDKGSQWYTANRSNTEVVKIADNAIQQAYFDMPAHHHRAGERAKKRGEPAVARGEYNKAIGYYVKYLKKYSKPHWNHLLVHTYLSALFMELKDNDKAAAEFNWIAEVNEKSFGRKPKDFPKNLLTKSQAAYNAVVSLDENRKQALEKLAGNKKRAYTASSTKKYLDQVKKFMRKYSKSKEAPDIAYNVALVHYEAENYITSVSVLEQLKKDFPRHKHTLLIKGNLAKSYTQAGKLSKAKKEYESLLKVYRKKRNTKMVNDINRSIAAVMFQDAEKKSAAGSYKKAAKLYLAMQKRFPTFEHSDKAIFEAGAAYENAKDYKNAAKTFLKMPKFYAKSELVVKSILRSAGAYKKAKDFKTAANIFLIVPRNFKDDKMAFKSIGFAANMYELAKSNKKAAETYEIAVEMYPKHPETPGYLYNACRTYEDEKLTAEAIRCNGDIVSKYKESQYALDAAFSIPIAYEKAKKWKMAAEAFIYYANNFKQDKPKLIASYDRAAKAYMKLKDEKSAAVQYSKVLKSYEKFGLKVKADPSVPAEASFMLGSFTKATMDPIVVKGSKKQKGKQIKKLTNILGTAMSHFANSASFSSEKWTFKATNEMGNLFVKLSQKIREQEIKSKKRGTSKLEDEFIMRLEVVQSLPSFYEEARKLFEKNIQIAREQGFYNREVIQAEEGYMQMWYQTGSNFDLVASAFRKAPVPGFKDLPREEAKFAREDYIAALEEKAQTAEDGGVPHYANGLKASAHYQVNNQWTSKIKNRVQEINPDHETLALTIEKFDPSTLFKDPEYFKQKARIEQLQKTSVQIVSVGEKKQIFQDIIEKAMASQIDLKKQVAELKAKLAPQPTAVPSQ